jgi:two-component system, sporulation sensor kinase A
MAKEFPIFKYEASEELINPDGLLDLFLNCSADGFAIVDMENRFIRVNPMYTQIFGYTEEDVIGKNFSEFPNPKSVYGIIDSVQKGQTFSNLVTQRTHKNGTVLDIAVSYSPLRNIEGEIIAVIAIFRDITEKVNLERELKKIKELYNLITENTTDMIKVFKKDFTIIYASPSFEKLTGRSTAEIVGRKITDFIFPDEVAPLTEMFQKLLVT